MRNLLFCSIFFVLILAGCSKDEGCDYSQLLIGTWINSQVDAKPVLTDKVFTMQFREDGVEVYSTGYELDASNKRWIENDKFTYKVDGKSIIIEGQGAVSGLFYMEFEIVSVDAENLIYRVPVFKIDNVVYPDSKLYSMKRVRVDLRAKCLGTWYGRSTSPDNVDGFHYWSYFPDGSFSYFYKDDLGHWVSKVDNNGGYFLYGNFLASNYSNDLLSGAVGLAYECWNVDIVGATMFWSGLRANNVTASFRMDRVSTPPVL